MISGNGVTISSADKTGAASISVGDNVNIGSIGQLSIVSPTSLTIGNNFTSQAVSSTFNAQNGALTVGDNSTLQGQTGISILSKGTNGSISIGSTAITMV